MTTLVSLSADPILRFVDNNGNALVGGQLTTLVGGINYPTWSDAQGQFQLPNPIILNDRGEIATQNGTSTPLWVDPNVSYTYILQDAQDNTIGTYPNIVSAATLPSIANLLTQSYLTQNFLGPILWPLSQPEIDADITPTFYYFPYGDVRRYGAFNDGSNAASTTVAINACLQVTGFGGAATYLTGGIYMVNADLIVPMGIEYLQGGNGPFGASLYGDGKEQTQICFATGSTITNGVYFNGGTDYELGGTISGIDINGNGVAPQCLTISFGDTTTARDLIVRGSTGIGISIDNSIMTRLEQILVGGNGSATAAQVEIDGTLTGSTGGTTTTVLEQVYISGSNPACICGLKIDRCNNTTMIGGAIESTGQVGLAISSKGLGTETRACAGISIIGVDFENLSDHYIEVGYGLASTTFVTGLTGSNLTGQGSSATQTPYAVKLNYSNGARFTNCAWGQPTSPTMPICTYWIEGNNGLRTVIDEHAGNFGTGYPWVFRNGAWLKSATPLVKFNANFSPTAPFSAQKAVTGTTWSVLVDTAQGGWYEQYSAGNSAATTVTTLTDGAIGMRVYIKGDGFSTLAQGTGTNQFNNTGAASLLLASGQYYVYMFNGTYWDQV